MTEKEKRREFFSYEDIPLKRTFTYDGCSVVFYEDTQKGEKRSFHSYMGGLFYRSAASPPNNKRFFTCDIYGNYMPVSLIRENIELQEELILIKKKCVFETKLRVFPTGVRYGAF